MLGAPLGAKARLPALLVSRRAAYIDDAPGAGLARRRDHRDRSAVVDALEGQAAARVLDRIAVELRRVDGDLRPGHRRLKRSRVGHVSTDELRAGPRQARAYCVGIARQHAHPGRIAQAPHDRPANKTRAARDRDGDAIHVQMLTLIFASGFARFPSSARPIRGERAAAMPAGGAHADAVAALAQSPALAPGPRTWSGHRERPGPRRRAASDEIAKP